MSGNEERKEKVEAAYKKLETSIREAIRFELRRNKNTYCETPLLSSLSEWSEIERELKDLHVYEGYYKSVLRIIMDNVSQEMRDENRRLRKIWCLNHGCHFPSLYLDDGELQCCSCMIDFKRDSIESIMNRIQQKNIDRITEEDKEKIRKLLGD